MIPDYIVLICYAYGKGVGKIKKFLCEKLEQLVLKEFKHELLSRRDFALIKRPPPEEFRKLGWRSSTVGVICTYLTTTVDEGEAWALCNFIETKVKEYLDVKEAKVLLACEK